MKANQNDYGIEVDEDEPMMPDKELEIRNHHSRSLSLRSK